MVERGQQSGRVVLWMVRADEAAFGDDVAAALGGIAAWTALAPGFEVGATRERLSEVLPEWGGGARLRLKSGGPILQYLQGRLRRPDWSLASDAEPGTLLIASELAYRWFPEAESPEHREAFAALVKTTMAILHRHTLPNRVELDGKPYRKSRIGTFAETFVRERGLEVKDGAWPNGQPLRLRSPR
jgi:hypothetical protein